MLYTMKRFFLSRYGYPKFWIRLLMALIGAFLVVIFGEEIDLLEIVQLPNFPSAMGWSFVIALILLEYTNLVSIGLDNALKLGGGRFDNSPVRIVGQVFGTFIPSIAMARRMAETYFTDGYDIDIKDTSYPYYEIHYITALLSLLNLIQVFCYFQQKNMTIRTVLKINLSFQGRSLGNTNTDLGGSHIQVPERAPKEKNYTWDLDTVISGVRLGEVAYFYLSNRKYFLCTHDGEKLIVEHSITKLMERLPKAHFFIVRRQLIISRKSFDTKKELGGSRWAISLNPPFKGKNSLSRVVTSKLKEWLGEGNF